MMNSREMNSTTKGSSGMTIFIAAGVGVADLDQLISFRLRRLTGKGAWANLILFAIEEAFLRQYHE